jgi:hypothetical protein
LQCRNFKWAAPGLNKVTVAITALLLGPALSGCILGTERPDLNLDVPVAYREGGHNTPDAHLPAVDWWRGFRSSELTSLMDAAQIYNLDIAVAIAQIAQADAQVGEAGAPLFPSLTGNGSAEQSQTSSNTAGGGGLGGARFSQYSLGLTARTAPRSTPLKRPRPHRATIAKSSRSRRSLPSPIPISRFSPRRMDCAWRGVTWPRPRTFS